MISLVADSGARLLAAQAAGLVALALCIIAFASKRDSRLFAILLFANIAFATQFVLFGRWVSAGIAALIVLRLVLVRRYRGNPWVMAFMQVATLSVAWMTWQGPLDLTALAAGVLGTWGMFMLAGVRMRLVLAAAALCWVLNNLLIGSIGGTLAESLILATNAVTITRILREQRRGGISRGTDRFDG